jgi:hypothetical protein
MGPMEQTFKIRESEILQSLEDISLLLDDTFIDECLENFTLMSQCMEKAIQRKTALSA